MQEYQARVIDEQADLIEKIIKLIEFTGAEVFAGLSDSDRDLLTAQLAVMVSYNQLLSQRIARF